MENEGTALITALEAVVKRIAPDESQLRGLVEAILADQKPRVLEVRLADNVVGKVDGHTRPEFEKIAMAVFAGVNVMLVGPAGCGKTHLAGQLAQALGLRFGFCSLSAGASEAKLLGRFCPIGANGQFQYVPAQFVDFYRNGGLFLLDEVDAADPNVLMVINAALANGHMEIPDPACPQITRHRDFRCVVAANTWGLGADRQYVGRNQLDAATLDRFSVGKFLLDYDEAFEKQVGHPDLVEWAHGLRRKIRAHGIRRICSTRAIIDGTRLMSVGFTLADIQASYFLDWTDNEKRLVGGAA